MKGDTLEAYVGKLVSVMVVEHTLPRKNYPEFYGKVSCYDDDFVTLNPFSAISAASVSFESVGTSRTQITIGRRYIELILMQEGDN